MLDQSITILKYEYHIAPGSYFHVETPWVKDVSEIKTVIIDQDNVFTKMLSVYPNNFVMFLEQFPDYSIYRTNFPLILLWVRVSVVRLRVLKSYFLHVT